MLCAIVSNSDKDFLYTHSLNGKSFVLDTRNFKNALHGISFSEPNIYMWIKSYLEEGENKILN